MSISGSVRKAPAPGPGRFTLANLVLGPISLKFQHLPKSKKSYFQRALLMWRQSAPLKWRFRAKGRSWLLDKPKTEKGHTRQKGLEVEQRFGRRGWGIRSP